MIDRWVVVHGPDVKVALQCQNANPRVLVGSCGEVLLGLV